MLQIQQILQHKIHQHQIAISECIRWRFKQEKIVFTNGCFDVLHQGHLQILAYAANLGNKLIVGLNSDASVKRLKGDKRPIKNEQTRAEWLAGLFFVNAVVIFEEDTPLNLINQIKPDVLVKGGDYVLEQIVGAKEVMAYGGKVEIFPLIKGVSSTLLIEKNK